MTPRFLIVPSLIIALSACSKNSDSSTPTPVSPATPAQESSVQNITTPQTASQPQPQNETPDLKDTLANTVEEAFVPTDSNQQTLTIDKAIDMMLASSPEIQKADERIKEYSYYTSIAKKKLFPSIEATAGYSYDEQKNGIQTYNIGFSQIVWDGTYSANVKLNIMRQLAEEQRARSVRRTMVVQTVAKYLNLLKANGGLIVSEAQFESVKRVYSQVGAAWMVGLADDQLKLEAEAEFNKGKLALQESQGRAKVACIELLNIIGSPDKKQFCVAPQAVEPPQVNLPGTDSEAVKLALENRPEVAIDAALVESAKAGKALSRADFYPKVVVGAQYGYTDSPFSSGGFTSPGVSNGLTEDWNVGVTVKIPIGDFGKKKKALAAAASKVSQAESDLRATQNRITTEVLTELTNLETAQQSVSTAESGETAATNLYKESLVAYKLGNLSLTDLLTRVASLSQAQQKSLEARYNLVQTLVNLKTSLGLENQP